MKMGNLGTRRKLEGLLFSMPWIIGFLAFWLFPLGSSLLLSFTHSTVQNFFGGEFVKFDNYAAVIADVNFGTDFMGTLTNSLINIPIILIFSVFAATLLNQKIRGRWFFRAVFFMSVILAGAVLTVLYDIGGANIGIGEKMTGQMAFLKDLLGEELISRLGMVIWQSSVQILIFLTGLQSIPPSIFEAANIDGAGPWETFWKITLPYLSPIVLLNLIYSIIDSFTEPTNKIIEMIKVSIYTNFDFGFASALSWLYFILILIFIGLIVGVAGLVSRRNKRANRMS